jgi:transcriptional regulator with XRE-family HTH domain
MRELRNAAGVNLQELARSSEWSKSRLSNAELGREAATYDIVRFYEERFHAQGVLLSLYQALEEERRERDRRRRPKRRVAPAEPWATPTYPAVSPRAVGYPHDRSVFIRDVSVPDDTVVQAGEHFVKIWEIQNGGKVIWEDRFLTRQGPSRGADIMESPPIVPIPPTESGEHVQIAVEMRAPFAEGSSVSIWKMTDEDGNLFFADTYVYGVTCQVFVAPGEESPHTHDANDRLELVRHVTVPPGTIVKPNTEVVKVWEVRNAGRTAGRTAWHKRSLQRVTPPAGPATMRSPLDVAVPDTTPGQTVQIEVPIKAARIEGTSVSYWIMTDETGQPFCPGNYLTCEMTVRRPHSLAASLLGRLKDAASRARRRSQSA